MDTTREEFLALFDSFLQSGDQTIFEAFLQTLFDAPSIEKKALADAFGVMVMSDNAMQNSSKSLVAAEYLGMISAEELRNFTIEEFKVVKKNAAKPMTA